VFTSNLIGQITWLKVKLKLVKEKEKEKLRTQDTPV